MSGRARDTWTSTADGVRDTGGAPSFAGGERRYEDQAELGRGGLGRVVATLDTVLDRVVARKEVLHNAPGHAERFVREARITARLEHPSIVPVYEAGVLEDGTPYYTMKRVDGSDLREAMDAARTLPQRLALLDVLLRVCEAAAYAHEQGVVHRDLKPENVMLGRFGETWVVDWGLAVEVGTDLGSGAVVGTPRWMSPEQARGQPAGPASDVWSLGAMLHAALTGHPPDRSDQRSVRDHQPGVPPDLAAVVDKALQPDPAARYPNAGALADELRAWLVGGRVSAYAYSPWQVLRREAWRHRGRLGAVVLVLAALLFGLAEAQRRETTLRDQALSSSLTRLGAIALRDRNLLLAGAHAAVAIGYRDDPEARGIAARALAAAAPARVEELPAGFPCRWLRLSSDGRMVVCGEEGLVAWRDGQELWRRPESTLAGALSPDGQQLVAILAKPGPPRVVVLDAGTGESLEEYPVGKSAKTVAWGDASPVWGSETSVEAPGGRRSRVCASVVSSIERDADGSLAVTCVDGLFARVDPDTLASVPRPELKPTVRYALLPEPDGSVWLGFQRTVRRLAGDVLGDPVAVGGYPVALAQSPDGRWLVAATHLSQAVVIDAHRLVPWLSVPTGAAVTGLAFAPNGSLWASGVEGPVRWALPTSGTSMLETLTDVAELVPLGPDHLVLTRLDGSMAVLDLPTWTVTEEAPPDRRRQIRALGDRVLVQWPGGDEVTVWWMGPGPADRGAAAALPADVEVTGLVPGGLLAEGVNPPRSLLYDPDTFALIASRAGIRAQALSDGSVAAVVDGGLQLLDPGTLATVRTIPSHLGDGAAVGVSGPLSDGRWAWVDTDAPALGLLWPDGASEPLPLDPGAYPVEVWVLPGDRLLVKDRVGELVVHDLNRPIARLPAGEARIGAVEILAGTVVTAADWDGRVYTWDLAALDLAPTALEARLLDGGGFAWREGRVRVR